MRKTLQYIKNQNPLNYYLLIISTLYVIITAIDFILNLFFNLRIEYIIEWIEIGFNLVIMGLIFNICYNQDQDLKKKQKEYEQNKEQMDKEIKMLTETFGIPKDLFNYKKERIQSRILYGISILINLAVTCMILIQRL